MKRTGKFSVMLSTFFLVVLSVLAFATPGVFGAPANSMATPATNTTAPYGTVNVLPGPYASFEKSFSPFNGNVYPAGIRSLIYEPLLQINPLTGETKYWLATGYNWSSDYKTLTFNIRQNVQWSDGKPFSASDVVYTYQLMKQYPALDANGVWSFLSNVTAPNSHTVVMSLKSVAVPELYFFTSVLIVPQHLWQNYSDPANYTDPNPVGTGPFMLTGFSPSEIILSANPNYWQPNEPHIATIQYNAYTSNTAAAEALESGSVQWAGLFEPNMTSIFVDQNPTYNHYYFAFNGPAVLLTNNLKWPLNQTYFRQAISMAINRTQLYQQGEYGYEQPSTALNMIPSQISDWANASIQSEAKYLTTFNITAAKNLLTSHGYTITSGKLYAPNGTAVPAMTIMTPAGWTDWDADIAFEATTLGQLGISVTVQTPTFANMATDVYSGDYWLAQWYTQTYGPTPYYIYSSDYFDNGNVVPIGGTAVSDFERWDSTTSGWLNYFNNFTQTANLTTQRMDVNKMSDILNKQMPLVPLIEGALWYEWTNSTITGFPTGTNYYWDASPYFVPGNEVVALNLTSTVQHGGGPSGGGTSPANYTVDYIIAGVVVAVALIAMIGFTLNRGRTKKP